MQSLVKCWASHSGNCSDKISREHVISRSLFSGPKLTVEGFDWCKEPKSIGINALTRKVLCTYHNSSLSPADEAIALLNNAVNSPRAFARIVGRDLENWFLKTLVNVSIGTGDHIGIGMNDSQPGWPSPFISAVVFEGARLTHHMGLYVLQCNQSYGYRQDEIIFVPLVRQGVIGGAIFGVAGIYFFFSLNPGARPSRIGEMSPASSLPDHVLGATMVHRPVFVECKDSLGREARIDIDWRSA